MKQTWELVVIASPVIIPVVVLLIFTLRSKWNVHKNSKNPETRVMAEVIDRRERSYSTGRGLHRRTVYEYYVTFRPVEGGMRSEFQVGEAEYRAYHLGDRGPLTYRTWEFISFRPENRSKALQEVPVAFADDDMEGQ